MSVFFWRSVCHVSLRHAKHLNALMIGEEEAHYLGVNIKKLKRIILTINMLMIAVATAFVGVISFIGLIVPHLLRIINGTLLGAILLCLSDLVARLLFAPVILSRSYISKMISGIYSLNKF